MVLPWGEYCRKCHESGESLCISVQFEDKYRRWARVTKVTMYIHDKSGDDIQANWAGDTLPVYNPVTGEQRPTYPVSVCGRTAVRSLHLRGSLRGYEEVVSGVLCPFP